MDTDQLNLFNEWLNEFRDVNALTTTELSAASVIGGEVRLTIGCTLKLDDIEAIGAKANEIKNPQ